MYKVKNYSRHEFNTDQVAALKEAGYEPDGKGARAPFFNSLQDFVSICGGRVVSAVLPGDIFREAWANQLTLSGIPEGTIMIGWKTDQEARKRGRFAIRGIVIHKWERVFLSEADIEGVVMPFKTYAYSITPTVESDFQTGEEFEYQC